MTGEKEGQSSGLTTMVAGRDPRHLAAIVRAGQKAPTWTSAAVGAFNRELTIASDKGFTFGLGI